MTMMRKLVALTVASTLGMSYVASGSALAQANCDWYAKTALKQQQDNERLKCGFKGDAWNADLKAHLTWCASVAPDAWKTQAQQRDQQLATCAKK